MLRVIAAARPRWVLAENVPGIIRMELDTVLSDLEAEGYATGTLIIPACAVNAPHRRDRVWIVAYTGLQRQTEHEKQAAGIEQPSQGVMAHTPNRQNDRREYGIMAEAEGQGGCIDTSIDACGEPENSQDIRRLYREGGDVRPVKPRLGLQNDGFPRWMARAWGTGEWEEDVPRVATNIKDRVNRLKVLGNAIVPQVAYQIIRNILEVENP